MQGDRETVRRQEGAAQLQGGGVARSQTGGPKVLFGRRGGGGDLQEDSQRGADRGGILQTSSRTVRSAKGRRYGCERLAQFRRQVLDM